MGVALVYPSSTTHASAENSAENSAEKSAKLCSPYCLPVMQWAKSSLVRQGHTKGQLPAVHRRFFGRAGGLPRRSSTAWLSDLPELPRNGIGRC